MTEEQLNKEQLRRDLKGVSYSNELLDKILELLSNQYINGLEQSRFDKRMLEFENQELKEQIRKLKSMGKGLDSEKRMLKVEIVNYKNSVERQKQEWINLLDMFKNQQKEFIEYLEDRIKFWKDKIFEIAITESDWTLMLWRNKLGILEESLSKYKEIIGVKDEENM